MRRGVAILALLVLLVAPAAVAQDEQMFVSVTFVKIKPGMEAAFMAASADHRDWHAEMHDTHYYNVSVAATGPRTGQVVFSAGPMTGEQMDDYDAFSVEDMADWTARGGNTVESAETMVLLTIPGLGNPPPAGYQAGLVNVYEIKIDVSKEQQFNQALRKFDELQKQVGDLPGYSGWVTVASGDSFGTYWYVNWLDGWAEVAPNPERQQRLVEAAGGAEAFGMLVGELTSALASSGTATYRPIPDLAFMPQQ